MEGMQDSKLTLKLVRNVIEMKRYKTKEDILNVIDYLIDEPKEKEPEKYDWDKIINEINAMKMKDEF